MKTSGVVLCLSLLASAPAAAARYDPDADRAALRQAATVSYSTVVEATGRALEPEQVPAISAGLDEGLRLARLAAAAAASLDGAARRRDAEMQAALKAASEAAIKELSEPVAAEGLRLEKLTGGLAELKEKVEALPDGENKKELQALLRKASSALRPAAELLRPLQASVKSMGERALAMREARAEALGPLVEVSSAAAGVIARAEELPAPLGEAKSRLGALGQEPRGAARSRAWETLELLRAVSRLLFRDADAACNRADDFRRRSAGFEKEFEAFSSARLAASAGPGAAKAFLDEAHKALALARERLKP